MFKYFDNDVIIITTEQVSDDAIEFTTAGTLSGQRPASHRDWASVCVGGGEGEGGLFDNS